MVFERGMPSCYSAAGFPAMADNIDDPLLVIAGVGLGDDNDRVAVMQALRAFLD